MKPKVRLPIWKVYLYNLLYRFRRFKWINTGMLEFGMTNKEKGLLHGMLHKYLRKEVMRQVKAVQYYELVSLVLGSKIAIATKEEIQLANKLFISYKINTKELIMEMKQLKKFAEEVGLTAKAIKGMEEDELILEIVKNLDADTTYSDDFIAWYDELPEEMFDEADAIDEEKPKGKGKKEKEVEKEEEEENDFSELIGAIEECTEIDELVEIAQDEDFEEIFAEVDTDTKLVKKLKKAMLKAIEDYEPEVEEEKPEVKEKGKKEEPIKEEKKRGRPAKEKEEVEEVELDDEAKEELVTAINEADSTEDLKEVADSVKEDYPELFKGIAFRSGRGKSPYRELEEVQAEMLEKLGAEVEEKEEEEETETELEITAESVNDAVEADDKETLVAMCEQLEIELKPLMKRSAKKMAEKIVEKLPKEKPGKRGLKGKDKKEKVEEVAEEKGEKQSVFALVEQMVNDGAKEKDIVAACEPILAERGKKKLFVAKFVKSLIAIVESLED